MEPVTTRLSRALVVLVLGLLASITGRAEVPDDRPNILLILADDLSWSDLACYGHPWHETPHLDKLAGEGMRLTSAYAPAPICSPSRAAILTGRTPARLGMEFVVKVEAGEQPLDPLPMLRPPPFTTDLALEEVTFAERLRERGYDTAYFGKWHLNAHYNDVYLGWSPTHGPLAQGFAVAEEDFGNHPYAGPLTPVDDEARGWVPDGLTERAIAYLERGHMTPFLLMVSHFYVHTPVESRYPWLAAKYDGKIPAETSNRAERITYAEFVEAMDHHIGELLLALEANGQAESTLVVFLADNGGHPVYTDNRPLRGSKWNLYEGGIRVPMLVRWPGRIASGSVSDMPVSGTDLYPTFLALAGDTAQATFPPIDGENILPEWLGEGQPQERTFYWHFPYYHPENAAFGRAADNTGHAVGKVSRTRPHSAIRHGRHKLIWFHETDETQLFDLLADPTESLDLALAHPELRERLKTALMRYLDEAEARMAEPRSLQAASSSPMP
jgi:arylsulfatase A-like enzyme